MAANLPAARSYFRHSWLTSDGRDPKVRIRQQAELGDPLSLERLPAQLAAVDQGDRGDNHSARGQQEKLDHDGDDVVNATPSEHLTDDYGSEPNNPGCLPYEPSAADATRVADRQSIKWRSWINPSTPVPTGLTTPALPGSTRVFERCDRLLKRLCASRLDNGHDVELRKLLWADLLIIDELPSSLSTPSTPPMPISLIIERHRAAATEVTSNREHRVVGLVADALLAQSAIDRLQSAAHQLVLEGNTIGPGRSPGITKGDEPLDPGPPPPA